MIKLDIINRLADETGIPKLKAEQAVEALFNSMKDALSRAIASSCADLASLSSNPGNAAWGEIHAPAKRWQFPRARRFASSRARSFKPTVIMAISPMRRSSELDTYLDR